MIQSRAQFKPDSSTSSYVWCLIPLCLHWSSLLAYSWTHSTQSTQAIPNQTPASNCYSTLIHAQVLVWIRTCRIQAVALFGLLGGWIGLSVISSWVWVGLGTLRGDIKQQEGIGSYHPYKYIKSNGKCSARETESFMLYRYFRRPYSSYIEIYSYTMPYYLAVQPRLSTNICWMMMSLKQLKDKSLIYKLSNGSWQPGARPHTQN
jgi:hypothetical protein